MATVNGHSIGVNDDGDRLVRSVCIVGAGAAGLCALRHFTTRPDRFGPIVCYEQTDQVGGTWTYSERIGCDSNGLPIHSSMYRDLHTNLPIQIMQFPDFDANCTKSYVHHSEVLKYLQIYANHFDLLSNIKFCHQLKHVKRDESTNTWKITVNDVLQHKSITSTFDIVVLCPGRHSRPFYPKIESIDQFEGKLIHSHDYRCREPYIGQRVAVVGGGPSGFDICIELSSVAAQIIFINRTQYQFKNFPPNVHQINGEICKFNSNSMFVKNGQQLEEYALDSVILATGYLFDLDYLNQEEIGLVDVKLNSDDTLYGLFRHMINIRYPTMAILGVCQHGVLPFPLYHQQILYYIQLLLNQIPTPSVDQMKQEVLTDLEYRRLIGYREKDRHALKVELLIDYVRLIEKDAQLEPLKPAILKLHGDLYQIRCDNITGYKQLSYRIVDDNTYEEV